MQTLFLDTETTGLNGQRDKIVEIAIVGEQGDVLLNTLVNPGIPIPNSHIHGITDAMVRSAPSFETLWPQISELMRGSKVVIYNASFDRKFFPDRLNCAAEIKCAMRAYAEHCGAQRSLIKAAAHIGYAWSGPAHRALDDTLACRAVWQWTNGTASMYPRSAEAEKAVPRQSARDGQATERREQAEREREKQVQRERAEAAVRHADRERAEREAREAAEALREEAHQSRWFDGELKAQAEQMAAEHRKITDQLCTERERRVEQDAEATAAARIAAEANARRQRAVETGRAYRTLAYAGVALVSAFAFIALAGIKAKDHTEIASEGSSQKKVERPVTQQSNPVEDERARQRRADEEAALAAPKPTVPYVITPTEGVHAIIDKVLNEARKSLPNKMDSSTTLVSVNRNGYTIVRTYRVAKPGAALTEKQIEHITQQLRTGACNNPNTRPILEMGYVVSELYTDMSGNKLIYVYTNHNHCK